MPEHEKLESLIGVGRDLAIALNAITDLSEALELCLQTALDVAGMDCGGIYLIDKDTGELNMLAHLGLSQAFVNRVSHYDADSIRIQIIKQGSPVYMGLANDPIPLEDDLKLENIKSLAVLPISHQDKVIGCLNVASHSVEAIPEYPRAVLETVAATIGSTIVRLRSEKALLNHQKRLRSLASELLLAEERERRRLATGLHDDVCQTMAFVKMNLQAMLASSDPINRETLTEVCDNVSRALDSTRYLTFQLCSNILYQCGFEEALEELLENQFHDDEELTSHFEDDGQDKPLGEDVKILLYQCVRELLTNVKKHAQAAHVSLSVQRIKNSIHVTVHDDGIGFQVEKLAYSPEDRTGFGLFNIKERLQDIGGRLVIDTHPKHGSSFLIIAPLELVD